VTGGPIVGGAAADERVPTGAAPDSPAARAAAMNTSPPAAPPPAADPPAKTTRPRTAPVPDHDDDRDPPSGNSGRRVVLVLTGILLLVVLGFVATFLYIRTQYYIAVADGSPETVGIYRGVSGSVLGIDMSRLSVRTDLPLSAVTDAQRPSVLDGIEATSEDDAGRIVASLRDDACAAAKREAEADAQLRRRHGERRAEAAPPPAYCEDSS
jgi:hypothetical protein